MVQTIQAKNVTLEELQTLFGLQLVRDDNFFREWQDELPEITDFQKQQLNQIKAGYFNLLEHPPLLEKNYQFVDRLSAVVYRRILPASILH
jgi:hypothetical protein